MATQYVSQNNKSRKRGGLKKERPATWAGLEIMSGVDGDCGDNNLAYVLA